MKKVGMIFIVVYIIAITTCAGVFATLYFVNKNDNPSTTITLTYEEAKVLANKVYTETNSKFGTTTSGTSMTEEPYTGEDFPAFITTSAGNMVSGMLDFSKDTSEMLNNNRTEGKWYKQTFSGFDRYLKFEIVDNKVQYYTVTQDLTNNEYRNVMNFDIIKTGKDTWDIEYNVSVYNAVGGNSTLSYYPQNMIMKFDGTKIYYAETTIAPLVSGTKVDKVNSADEIAAVGYAKCDLNKHVALDRISTMEMTELLSDAEKVTLTNEVLKKMSQIKTSYTLADFGEFGTIE